MFLFINTASAEDIFLALVDSKGDFLVKKKIKAKYRQSEKLLLNIKKIVGKNLESLRGVIVVKGPGSFTALRIGVATANTMAWALQIPIIGVRRNDMEKMEELAKKSKKLKKFKLVVPEYGREPNISKPKKD